MQAPYPPLTEYYAREADRRGLVGQLFDRTAGDYDRIERALAFGSGSWYRRQALQRAGLGAGMRVLDVGVGTGLTARQAARLVGDARPRDGCGSESGHAGAQAQLPARCQPARGQRRVASAAEAVARISYAWASRCAISATSHWHSTNFGACWCPAVSLCLLEITPPARSHGRIRCCDLHARYRAVLVASRRRHGARDAAVDALLLGHDRGLRGAGADHGGHASRAGFTRSDSPRGTGDFLRYCARKPRATAPSASAAACRA